MLPGNRPRNHWNINRTLPSPLIVYFLSKVTGSCWSFILHFIYKWRSWGRVSFMWTALPVTGENWVTVKPSGTSLNISSISHELPALGPSRGETDLYLQSLDNVKVRSGIGILHPFSLCSRVPWARWDQSISNGRGHRSDTIRGTRAEPPSSTIGPDTHISSYCRCFRLKNYTRLVLLFLPFLFLKHDFHPQSKV